MVYLSNRGIYFRFFFFFFSESKQRLSRLEFCLFAICRKQKTRQKIVNSTTMFDCLIRSMVTSSFFLFLQIYVFLCSNLIIFNHLKIGLVRALIQIKTWDFLLFVRILCISYTHIDVYRIIYSLIVTIIMVKTQFIFGLSPFKTNKIVSINHRQTWSNQRAERDWAKENDIYMQFIIMLWFVFGFEWCLI